MISLPEFLSRFDDIHLLCTEGGYDEIRRCLYNDPTCAQRHNENGHAPIHQVVLREHDDVLDVLELILNYPADVNGRTVVEGDTALHLVVRNVTPRERACAIARRLIMYGANPRIRNNKGVTAYDEAVARCYTDLADLLNSDRWIRDKEALVTAICSGTLNDINRVLRLGPDVDKKTELLAAPIHYVISHRLFPNRVPVLKALVKHDVFVNATNHDGDTVLHLAVKDLNYSQEMLDILRFLLDSGIAKSLKNKNGETARDLAVDRDYDDVVEILDNYIGKCAKNEEKDSKWFKAVETNKIDQIHALMKEKGDKKLIYNEEGHTPLHVCVNAPFYPQQIEMIDTLLTAGIDINAQTKIEGDTALHLAAYQDNHQAAEVLVKNQCNTKLKNKKNLTAVDVCDEKGHDKVKEMIVGKSSSCCIVL